MENVSKSENSVGFVKNVREAAEVEILAFKRRKVNFESCRKTEGNRYVTMERGCVV